MNSTRLTAPSRIALLGLFGVGNLGNDTSLQAMIYHVRKRQPDADLVCITPAPEEVSTRFGIPSVYMAPVFDGKGTAMSRVRRIARKVRRRVPAELRQSRAALSQLRCVDRLIIPGTGALDDFGISPLSVPYSLLHWTAVAKLARCQVDFVSVGAGPIQNPLSRFLMLQALRVADYRSYRDDVSKKYLQSIGFNSERDPLYPDLVFSLPVNGLAGMLKPVSPPKSIGIGVMGYYGWENDRAKGESIYRTYVIKLIQFVTWLLDEGYTVRLLIGERPTDQRPVEDIMAAVSQHRAAQEGAISASAIENMDDVFREISTTDLVVATRFHNVLCSLMLGRPVISIGYAAKNEALLDEMGLHGYSQHIESFDVGRLQRQFKAMTAAHGSLLRDIDVTNRRYRDLLDEQYDSLFA